jgi:hypothetical protein
VANPFSRTTRSLKTDGHRTALLALLVAILLLAIWGLWFFAAGISIHVSSEGAQLSGSQRVLALFPSDSVGAIRRGQEASFYPEGAEWAQTGPIPAAVSDITTRPDSGQVQVELVLRLGQGLPAPLRTGMKGRVEIELERVSPAKMVLRGGGLVDQANARGQ